MPVFRKEKKVAQGTYSAMDADLNLCPKVLLEQRALGGAGTAGLLPATSFYLCFTYFCVYGTDSTAAAETL